MNTPLPPDHDDDLPGEAELAALYRKLPKSEPGPALDAAILRAATQALSENNASPAQASSPRTRWLIPLSSAATLVLAAGLAWHMRGMPAAETVTIKAAAPSIISEKAAPATPAQDQAPAPAPKQMAPSPQSMTMTAPAMSPMKRAKTAEVARQPTPPSAPAIDRMAKPPAPALIARTYTPEAETLEQDVSASAVATDESRMAAHIRSIKPPASPAISGASDGLSEETISAAPAPASPPPSAAGAATGVPEPLAEKAQEPEATRNVAAKNPAGPVTMQVAPAVMAASGIFPVTARDAADTPAQELGKIRQLFAEHRDDEAKKRLAAFRRDHPDQVLPADLRARLPRHP